MDNAFHKNCAQNKTNIQLMSITLNKKYTPFALNTGYCLITSRKNRRVE